jgi:exodeoxyribonuclease VIII
MATLKGVQASIHRHDLARKILSKGKGEVTVSWVDEPTGVKCKARADYFVESLGMVADLKLVEDASLEGFRKSVARYRYFVQDAMYREGFAAVGKPLKYFVFIAVEKEPPYASAIYALDADGIATGFSAVREGINEMARCLETGIFPGYPTGITTIGLPAWVA